MDAAEVWFVGDMHLGRRSAGLPEGLRDYDIDPQVLDPKAAWLQLVEYAVSRADGRGPEAIVLAGDVVEADAARFEAWGCLVRGVEALRERGIAVLAVAGNHDVEALPRLAREIEGFELLGAAGTWEERELSTLRILGWSFPTARVSTSPLLSLSAWLAQRAGGGVEGGVEGGAEQKPLIGVCHGDLDAPRSPYAPLALADLRAQPVAAWLLGHIHAPSLVPREQVPAGDCPIGYLGSLTPLHRAELGPHGPWRVRVGEAGGLSLEQLALAPLRWELLEIAADELEDPEEDLQALIGQCVRRRMQELLAEPGAQALRVLALRLRIVGRTAVYARLEKALQAIPAEGFCLPLEGRVAAVLELRLDARPALDLERLAAGSDALAFVARELSSLEAGASELPQLVEESCERLMLDARFRSLQLVGSPEEARQRLLRVGHRLLEQMLRVEHQS